MNTYSTHRRRIAVILVLVGLILLPWAVRRTFVRKSNVQHLIEASENLPYRPSAARLSVDDSWRPVAPRLRGGESRTWVSLNTQLLAAVSALDRDVKQSDVDQLQASVPVSLYFGDAAKTVVNLEEALRAPEASTKTAEQRAALLNDLAVAYLETVTDNDRHSLVNALDAVERASVADQKSLAVAWTRAVLLDSLNQKGAALQAWKEYLRRDPDSGWSVEARERLSSASAADAKASFTEIELRKALKSGDINRTRAIVAAFPQETRSFGEEEALAEWAQEFLHGSNAPRLLRELRDLASALRGSTGESLLTRIVDEIEGEHPALSQRATAFLQYKEARDVYRSGQVKRARELLDTAERSLRDLNSHLAILANIYRAGAVYKENRFADTLKILDPALDPCGAGDHYYAACGLKSWIEGLALVQTGRPSASIESYGCGLTAFNKARESENIASMLTLRAETLDFVSAMDEAWSDRMTALEMFRNRPIGARPLVWMTVALAALRDHRDYAAITMLDEIASDARKRDDAMWTAEAMIWRALPQKQIHGLLTDTEIDAIRAAINRIEDPSVRARSEANLGLILAEVRGSDPAARGDLDRALQFYLASNDQFNRTAALSQRADVHASMKNFAAADADVVAALEEFQRQAEGIGDPFMRTLFGERSRALFITASRVQASSARPLASLWLSDRARRVALWGLPGTISAAKESTVDAERRGNDLLRALPPKLTIVHQDVDGNQLRTWVIRDGQVHFDSHFTNAEWLQTEVMRFRTQLQQGDPSDPVVPRARSLYDLLLRPVHGWLYGTGWLVYSPSPELRGLPFGALHDGHAFLSEQRTVALARSLETLTRMHPRTFDRKAAILIVNAAADGSPLLEGAESEVVSLARLYGTGAAIMAGAEATPAKFAETAPDYDVIHVAAHGLKDRRPLHNAMLFGAERLRAYDVMRLSLKKGPLVVLAGCSTDDGATGRTTLSLANAFEVAGASAVIGSLWDVDDRGTEQFMTRFHRELLVDGNAQEALHRTQRDAIRKHDMSAWPAFQMQL